MHRRPIHSVLIPTFYACALLLAVPAIAAPLARDTDGDGDFADAGENQTLTSSAGADAALALNGGDRALIAAQTKIVVGVTD